MDELSSDTGEFLTTVELILHAGDVTAPSVLDWCEQFAPIYVARGNNDIFDHPSLAEGHLLEIEGWRIIILSISTTKKDDPMAFRTT